MKVWKFQSSLFTNRNLFLILNWIKDEKSFNHRYLPIFLVLIINWVNCKRRKVSFSGRFDFLNIYYYWHSNSPIPPYLQAGQKDFNWKMELQKKCNSKNIEFFPYSSGIIISRIYWLGQGYTWPISTLKSIYLYFLGFWTFLVDGKKLGYHSRGYRLRQDIETFYNIIIF